MRKKKVGFAVTSVFVLALAIAGAVLLTNSGSSALGASALAGLVGGEITPGCGFATGLAAGLTIGAIGAAVTPGGQGVGAALGIAAVVIGFVTYLACS